MNRTEPAFFESVRVRMAARTENLTAASKRCRGVAERIADGGGCVVRESNDHPQNRLLLLEPTSMKATEDRPTSTGCSGTGWNVFPAQMFDPRRTATSRSKVSVSFRFTDPTETHLQVSLCETCAMAGPL